MGAMHAANLAVRFALELTALGILGLWGLHAWTGGARAAMALAAPLVLAVTWGLVASPQAPVELSTGVKVAVQMVLLFCVPVLALLHLGRPGQAAAFGAAVLVNAALMLWWAQ